MSRKIINKKKTKQNLLKLHAYFFSYDKTWFYILIIGLLIGVIPCFIVGYHTLFIHPDDKVLLNVESKELCVSVALSALIMVSSLFIDD